MASVQINGVIHQTQLNRRACWYTCLQMEVRYHENVRRQCLANLRGPETFTEMQQRFDNKSNPSWAEWREWAQKCGFSPLDLCPTIQGVYNFISRYGPIVYSGTWGNTFDGHVVLITGANTDNGSLYVDDPLESSAPVTKDMNTYFAQLTQTLWENPLFVYKG